MENTDAQNTAQSTDVQSTDADAIIILSSELIAEVMEQHFNKYMFKQAVSVVELKSTESGYMFSILFVKKAIAAKPTPINLTVQEMTVDMTSDRHFFAEESPAQPANFIQQQLDERRYDPTRIRNEKGRFVSHASIVTSPD